MLTVKRSKYFFFFSFLPLLEVKAPQSALKARLSIMEKKEKDLLFKSFFLESFILIVFYMSELNIW